MLYFIDFKQQTTSIKKVRTSKTVLFYPREPELTGGHRLSEATTLTEPTPFRDFKATRIKLLQESQNSQS